MFPVSNQRLESLIKRMNDLGIHERDLKESFVQSSGPGGQNVNKVATCVVLYHEPSGIQIKCQKTRTQGLNRFWARVMLVDRVEADKKRRVAEAVQKKAKTKRQNRKRPKWLKESILENKKRQSTKKEGRGRKRGHQVD